MEKITMQKNWKLGFFGFFFIFAIPPLLKGEIIWATWLLWALWFLHFIPEKKK
jgi:hypothetical protein